jgi:hypothetical protein
LLKGALAEWREGIVRFKVVEEIEPSVVNQLVDTFTAAAAKVFDL